MDSFKPVKNVKITELIVDQIRKAILEGTMKPGDKLPSERELSEKFEASRIAVREALISLESAGLVQIKPGSGAFVANITSKTMSQSLYSILRMQNISLDEITEARLIIEPHIARLASERASKEDIQRLEQNVEEASGLIGNSSIPTSRNIGFHGILAEMTHNAVIIHLMQTLLDVMDAMFSDVDVSDNVTQRMRISRGSINQHKNIIKALKDGNHEGVYQFMLGHIVEIQKGLQRALKKREKKI